MKGFVFLFILVLGILSQCPTESYFNTSLCFESRPKNQPNCYFGGYPESNSTVPSDLVVAFVSDVGSNRNSRDVLNLIKDNNASIVFHAGDLDYRDNPSLWEEQVDDILGMDFHYYTSIGNHELDAFDGPNGYQQAWFDRLLRLNARCFGTVGLGQMCSYLGITFFLAAPWKESYPSPFISQMELAQAIEDSFNQFGDKWRICIWHFNYDEYQLGNKATEADIFLYDTCRRVGAIIQNGHEHSYARTHLMSSFENFTIASTSDEVVISEGESILVISAAGGQSIRPCVDNSEDNPWWASALCSNSDPPLDYGALFCRFNPSGEDENFASCWYEQVDNVIRDQFTLNTTVEPSSCCQVESVSCRDNITYTEPAVCEDEVDIGCGFNISCTCSMGESCSGGSCECNEEECSELGRVCTQWGCVFPFNENVNTGSSNSNANRDLIIVVSVIFGTMFIAFFIAIAVDYGDRRERQIYLNNKRM